MKRRARFNINDPVRVRLTPEGLAIHRSDWQGFVASLPPEARDTMGDYKPPEIDADGFWSTSAWHLMQLFGPHIHLGAHVPFETWIEFEVDLP